MYLTLPQKVFRAAVHAVGAIAGTGNLSLPILKHLLLVADATGMTLHAANGQTSMRYRVPAIVQAPGTLLLPAQLFAGFIQDLPAAPITLVWPSPTDSMAVQVRCQQVTANIKQGAMPGDEFPPVLQLTTDCRELLTVDSDLLRDVIEQVAFAADTDPSRPVLEGIRLALGDGRASFGAANAFRLGVRQLAIPDPELTAEVLLPAHALRSLARLLPETSAVHLALSPDGHQALFHTAELDLATRLIEGTFPDFRGLLEAPASTQVLLPTQALAEAVHLMAPFARENAHRLRLQIQHDRPGEAAALVLEAEAPDLGANEIRLTESVTIEGPEQHLFVNESFLAEILKAIVTPQVRLGFQDARKPVVIRPVGPFDCTYVVMPLFAQEPAPSSRPSHPASAAQGASVPGTAATH